MYQIEISFQGRVSGLLVGDDFETLTFATLAGAIFGARAIQAEGHEWAVIDAEGRKVVGHTSDANAVARLLNAQGAAYLDAVRGVYTYTGTLGGAVKVVGPVYGRG